LGRVKLAVRFLRLRPNRKLQIGKIHARGFPLVVCGRQVFVVILSQRLVYGSGFFDYGKHHLVYPGGLILKVHAGKVARVEGLCHRAVGKIDTDAGETIIFACPGGDCKAYG